MKVVGDSNVFFSALISGKDIYLDIFKALQIYVPDFIFIEIAKYQEKIIKKTSLEDEFVIFVRQLFSEIRVIPRLGISDASY